jgi:hypothetical protein
MADDVPSANLDPSAPAEAPPAEPAMTSREELDLSAPPADLVQAAEAAMNEERDGD